MQIFKNERGYTLLIALGVLIIVSVVGVSLMGLTSNGIVKNEKRQHVTQAGQHAEDGVKHLVQQIQNDIRQHKSNEDVPTVLDNIFNSYSNCSNPSIKEQQYTYEGQTKYKYEACIFKIIGNGEIIIKGIGHDLGEEKILYTRLKFSAVASATDPEAFLVPNNPTLSILSYDQDEPKLTEIKITAIDDIRNFSFTKDTNATRVNDPIVQKDTSIVALNLLNIVDLKLLNFNNIKGFEFNVNENEILKNMTIEYKLTTVGISLFTSNDVTITVLKEIEPGKNEIVHSKSIDENNLICLLICTANHTTSLATLEQGKYKIVVTSKGSGALNLGLVDSSSMTTKYTRSTVTPTVNPKNVQNLLTNDIYDDTTFVSSVKFGAVTKNIIDATNFTEVKGTYGTLYMKQNGDYYYSPNYDLINEKIVETFSYTITNTNGQTSTADLTFSIDQPTILPFQANTDTQSLSWVKTPYTITYTAKATGNVMENDNNITTDTKVISISNNSYTYNMSGLISTVAAYITNADDCRLNIWTTGKYEFDTLKTTSSSPGTRTCGYKYTIKKGTETKTADLIFTIQ